LVCSASGLLGHLQGGEVNSRNRSFPWTYFFHGESIMDFTQNLKPVQATAFWGKSILEKIKIIP
jgi:hypothetical protein